VGKYMPRPTKQIHGFGARGQVRIDRDRNELHITPPAGQPFTLAGPAGVTGYGGVARALAIGTPLPPLLAPAQPLQVLRLVDEAQARARVLPVYPVGDRRAMLSWPTGN
jgi:hypothetical protein